MASDSLTTVRPFRREDAPALALLFHNTVRVVNRHDYSQAQVEAWAPDDLHFRDWVAQCCSRLTWVAETNGMITGFVEWETHGPIDCFYCHHDYQRQGMGTALWNTLREHAQSLGCPLLTVEASLTARPFFLKLGFREGPAEQVSRRGQMLTRIPMSYPLSAQTTKAGSNTALKFGNAP